MNGANDRKFPNYNNRIALYHNKVGLLLCAITKKRVYILNDNELVLKNLACHCLNMLK